MLPGGIGVKLSARDWLRASEVACPVGVTPPAEGSACSAAAAPPVCDAQATAPGAADYLPRIARCVDSASEQPRSASSTACVVRYQNVIVTRTELLDLIADPNGDLSDGSGPRFVVDDSNPARCVIRVLTDRLGVVQGFWP